MPKSGVVSVLSGMVIFDCRGINTPRLYCSCHMTFTYDDVYEFDSSGDHTGKPEPGFHLSAYTWGYNYRTDRRVTKYERWQLGSTIGLEGNPRSGRFTLSLIHRHETQLLEEEVPCLYELLLDWILNKDEYKPIDWHSEEYPWNWKIPSDEVEA